MAVKLKKLSKQVIVITGASSSIGLTTAGMAAEAGATVVLTSDNEPALREALTSVSAKGGRATFVVADVADPDAMRRLARQVVQEFGRIDTWVNNAGIGAYGKLMDTPLEDKRRLFDINFWGVIHGCRAALDQMRDTGGAIINLGSIMSDSTPMLGIYAASKQAVKAYTDALRMELEYEQIPVSVTLIKPVSVSTPFIVHAGSYRENAAELLSPVYSPEEAARAILHCAQHPMRDMTIGASPKMFGMLSKTTPRAMQRVGDRPAPAQRSASKRPLYRRAVPLVLVGAAVAAAVRGVRPPPDSGL
jgi:short-subunit dehydrogenase